VTSEPIPAELGISPAEELDVRLSSIPQLTSRLAAQQSAPVQTGGQPTVPLRVQAEELATVPIPRQNVVTLTLPPQPTLDGAIDITTPMFAPVAQGGQEAEFDEYRCFAIDAPVTANSFLTGYAVTPGDASIVHHLITFVVDPQAAGQDGRTNGAIMQALDDESPDRLGWPCFGAAGDNVDVSGVPVTWAPGQGIVEYGLILALSSALTAVWLLVFGGAIADALSFIGQAIDRATGG
jgi:Flp pilus assembly pilin Flp